MEIQPKEYSIKLSRRLKLRVKLFPKDKLIIEIVNKNHKIYQQILTEGKLQSYKSSKIKSIQQLYEYIKKGVKHRNIIKFKKNYEIEVFHFTKSNQRLIKQCMIIKTHLVNKDHQIFNFGQDLLSKYRQKYKEKQLKYQILANYLNKKLKSRNQPLNHEFEQIKIEDQIKDQIEDQIKVLNKFDTQIRWIQNQIKLQSKISIEQVQFMKNQQRQRLNLFTRIKKQINRIKKQLSQNNTTINQEYLESQRQLFRPFLYVKTQEINVFNWNNQQLLSSSQMTLDKQTNIFKRQKLKTNRCGWVTIDQSLRQYKRVYLSIKLVKFNVKGKGIEFGIYDGNTNQTFTQESLLLNPIGTIWNSKQSKQSQIINEKSIIGVLVDWDSKLISWFDNMKLIQTIVIPQNYFKIQQIFPIIYIWQIEDRLQFL